MLLGIYNFAYKFHSKADYQRYAHHNPKYKKNSKRKNKWNIGAVPNCCFIFIIPMNISTWKKNVFEPRPLHSGTFEPNTFQLFKSYSEFGLHNAKVSVKRPVLLIDLVWIFSKNSLLNNQVHLKTNLLYYYISGPPQPIFDLYLV